MEQVQAPAIPASGLMTRVLIALAVAAVVLVGFVLPAEYGMDPTGLGKAMGLTQMASSAPTSEGGSPEGVPALPMAPPDSAGFQAAPFHSDEVKIKLKGDGELEYKFRLKKGESIVYSWKSDTKLYYDFHAESEPKPGEDKTNYKPTVIRYKEEMDGVSEAHGSLTAPFDGIHGWYWLNLDSKPTTVTMKVSGFYTLRPASEQPTETE